MATALVFPYTDPNTGAAYPEAYLEIEDVRVHLIAGLAILGIAIWGSQALHDAGKEPIYRNPDYYMTGSEIATERPKFLSDLYGLLADRAQFAGATVIG